MTGLWEDERSPFAGAFEEAAQNSPWHKVVKTQRHWPCRLHTEPGPEMFELEDGTEVEVTAALRQQWEREGVTTVVQIVYVGTCHTNRCHEKGEQ